MRRIILLTIISIFLFSNVNGQWRQTNGPYGANAFCFTSTNNGNDFFVGTGKGVYTSVNNGINWTPVNNGLYSVYGLPRVWSLQTIGSDIFAATDNGMFISVNNGASWTAINNGLPQPRDVRALAVSGSNIYAGINGVYVSTNHGASWSARNNGLTSFSTLSIGTVGSNVYSSSHNGGNMLSTDSAASWTPVGPSGTGTSQFASCDSFVFIGTYGNGIYRSSDNSNWSLVNNGLTDLRIRSLAVSGNNIFAGTIDGVFLSSDNGANWTSVSTGLRYPIVQSLGIAGAAVLAGNSKGVFLSTNNGSNWTEINNGLKNSTISAFATTGNSIYAAVWGNGVSVSHDQGNTWSEVNNGLTEANVYSLTILGNKIFAGTNEGIYLSTDSGANWNLTTNFLSNYIVGYITHIGNYLFASISPGLYRSIDSGATWNAVNTGFPLPVPATTSMITMGNKIFAGTYNGIFCSTDTGVSWTESDSGTINNTVASLAVSGSRIFAGTSNTGGVYVSSDSGAFWTSANTGLPGFYSALDLLPLTMNKILAVISDKGIYFSGNNGLSWNPMNNGLTDLEVEPLTLITVNDIYAGTTNSGVFRTDTTHLFSPVIATIVSVTNDSCRNTNSGSATAAGSGGIPPYAYSWNSNPVQTSAQATNLGVGQYIVTVTDSSGFSDTASVIITEPQLPNVASSATTLCIGDSVTLSTVSAATYLWSNGDTTQYITVTDSGDYSVTVTYSNGCSDTSQAFHITLIPFPAITASITLSGPAEFCQGDTLTLTGSPTGVSYFWIPLFFNNSQSIEVTTSGFYFLIVADSNGCSSTSEPVTTTVIPLPNVNFSGLPGAACITSTPVSLAGTPPGGTFSGAGVSGNVFTPSAAGTGSHSVSYLFTDTTGCSNSSTQPVYIDSFYTAAITANGPDEFCFGDSVQLLANAGMGFTYQWLLNGINIPGAASSFYYADSSGIYSFYVSNSCADTTSNNLSVTVNPLPAVSFLGLPDTVCSGTSSIILTGNPSGGAFNGAGVKGNLFNALAAGAGNHVVVYSFTDSSGCSNAYSDSVFVDFCLGITNAQQNIFAVTIFPNPSSDHFSLKVKSSDPSRYLLILYDIAGREIESQNPGVNEAFNFGYGLSEGFYFVEIIQGENKQVVRLIKN